MSKEFSERFSSQWIKVKFYDKEPRLDGVTRPKNIRFCEALNLAVTQPVILSKENISCQSAQYVFGWKKRLDRRVLDNCLDKSKISDKILKSLLLTIPRFKNPFNYIGLNIDDGKPDLLISCVVPEDVMRIIKVYNNHSGKNMNVSLNSMMGFCGNVAVKTYLQKKVSISFGCSDSRKFSAIGRDKLAIGIPRKLFKLFVG